MKKFICTLVAASFMLVGCGGTEEKKPPTIKPSTPATAPKGQEQDRRRYQAEVGAFDSIGAGVSTPALLFPVRFV